MPDKVLVIGAHCDDTEFGCLGTLLKFKALGSKFFFLAFTQARGTKKGWKKAADYFNAQRQFQALKDQKLDVTPLVELIEPIEKVLKEYKPNVVFTPFIGDLNADHRLVSEASMVACRPYKHNSPKEIWMYEIPGSTELGLRPFNTDRLLIVDALEKRRLLKEWYPNEMINGREKVNDIERFERWPR